MLHLVKVSARSEHIGSLVHKIYFCTITYIFRVEYCPANCLQSKRLSSQWFHGSGWPLLRFRTILKFGPFKFSRFKSFKWSSVQPISVRHEWHGWRNGSSAYSYTTQYHWRKRWILYSFWTNFPNSKSFFISLLGNPIDFSLMSKRTIMIFTENGYFHRKNGFESAIFEIIWVLMANFEFSGPFTLATVHFCATFLNSEGYI